MLKLCGKCNKQKDISLFNWKNEKRGWRHAFCKECHAGYRRKHYLDNRIKYIAKALVWNGAQRLKLQKVVLSYLKNHPCIDCGENDVLVLEFDHRTSKIKGIAEMVQSSCSVGRVLAEIKKCDVRCANCHRRKTSKDLGFWKMGA